MFPGAALWAPGGPAYAIGEMAIGEFKIVGVVPARRAARIDPARTLRAE